MHQQCYYLNNASDRLDLYIMAETITKSDTSWLSPYGVYTVLSNYCPYVNLTYPQRLLLNPEFKREGATVLPYKNPKNLPVTYANSIQQALEIQIPEFDLVSSVFPIGIAIVLTVLFKSLWDYTKIPKPVPAKVSTKPPVRSEKRMQVPKVDQKQTMPVDKSRSGNSPVSQGVKSSPMPKQENRFIGYQQEEGLINNILKEHKTFFRIDPRKKVLITPKTIIYPLQRAQRGKFSSLYSVTEVLNSEIYSLRLQHGYRTGISSLILTQPPCLIVPRVDPLTLHWADRRDRCKPIHMLTGLSYETGKPEPLTLNLNSPTQFSILIGGTSGSGKSTLLDGMIISICEASSPEEFKLIMIDIGLKHFSPFSELPHCTEVVSELDQALETLRYVEKQMTGPEDQYPYRTAIVIDEIQKLTKCGIDAKEKEFKRLLMMIASNGRAYGYSIIIATQKPKAGTIPTDVRDNCVVRIAGKCFSQGQSEMILGDNHYEATHLSGVGSFAIYDGNATTLIYSYMLNVKQEIKAIRDRYPNYVSVPLVKQESIPP